jgi:hypothetical protein
MPDGNTQTGKLPKAEDLKNTFARDVREFHREKERILTGKPSKQKKNTLWREHPKLCWQNI